VVAVADGVSQGEWSLVAAQTAARAACKLVVDHDPAEGVDWSWLSRRLSVRIVDEAEYRRLIEAPGEDDTIDDRIARCVRRMSCTLVVAVLHRRPDEHGCFPVELAVVAGDSGAYVLDGTGLRLAAGGKDETDSPVTSSAVRPLPGAVHPTVAAIPLAPGQALVLVTDGVGDAIGAGTGEVARELAERWRTPPTIDRFLLDVNFLRRSFDDDRTAVAVWAPPSR
jgi:serine/threonine protein phosphatase PrpC